MLAFYLAIMLLSFGLIYWSADRMLDGAVKTASQHNIPIVVVGVVVVGFGTSAPEILVSALAAVNGSSEIALGNLLGSNFTNIALVLGLTGILSTAVFSAAIVRYYLISVFALGVVGLFLWLKQSIEWRDGIIMLALLLAFLCLMAHTAKRSPAELEGEVKISGGNKHCLLMLFGGLVALLLASEATVWSAIKVAALLNIDELIIGLTVVAIGTSLPELVASALSALRHQHSIAVGNLMGSNIFNSIGGVGFSALLAPLDVPPSIFSRDFAVVFSVSLLLGLLILLPRRMRIRRWKGSLLLLCFVAYLILLYRSAEPQL